MANSSQPITFEQIMTQTITFIDSAYPEPHNLREFVWSDRLDDQSKLWFDLHLISKDYYANEPDDIEDEEEEESAFSIYLAGHDAYANHKISFNQQSDEKFHILWQGDIALFYSGFTEFIHQFKTDLNDVAFDGFYFPKDWDLDKSIVEFKKVLTDFENYECVVINPKHHFPQYKLMRI